jgi:hypothetical protein
VELFFRLGTIAVLNAVLDDFTELLFQEAAFEEFLRSPCQDFLGDLANFFELRREGLVLHPSGIKEVVSLVDNQFSGNKHLNS